MDKYERDMHYACYYAHAAAAGGDSRGRGGTKRREKLLSVNAASGAAAAARAASSPREKVAASQEMKMHDEPVAMGVGVGGDAKKEEERQAGVQLCCSVCDDECAPSDMFHSSACLRKEAAAPCPIACYSCARRHFTTQVMECRPKYCCMGGDEAHELTMLEKFRLTDFALAKHIGANTSLALWRHCIAAVLRPLALFVSLVAFMHRIYRMSDRINWLQTTASWCTKVSQFFEAIRPGRLAERAVVDAFISLLATPFFLYSDKPIFDGLDFALWLIRLIWFDVAGNVCIYVYHLVTQVFPAHAFGFGELLWTMLAGMWALLFTTGSWALLAGWIAAVCVKVVYLYGAAVVVHELATQVLIPFGIFTSSRLSMLRKWAGATSAACLVDFKSSTFAYCLTSSLVFLANTLHEYAQYYTRGFSLLCFLTREFYVARIDPWFVDFTYEMNVLFHFMATLMKYWPFVLVAVVAFAGHLWYFKVSFFWHTLSFLAFCLTDARFTFYMLLTFASLVASMPMVYEEICQCATYWYRVTTELSFKRMFTPAGGVAVSELEETESLRQWQELVADEQIKESTWKLCPRCRAAVQRIDGCNDMVCGRDFHASSNSRTAGCGHRFGYSSAPAYVRDLSSHPLFEKHGTMTELLGSYFVYK